MDVYIGNGTTHMVVVLAELIVRRRSSDVPATFLGFTGPILFTWESRISQRFRPWTLRVNARLP